MYRRFSGNRRVFAAVLGSIAMLLPMTAMAGSSQHRGDRHGHAQRGHSDGHNDYRRGHHRGHDRHARNRHNYRRGSQRHYRDGRYASHRPHYRANRYNRSHHANSRYYCAQCDHGFHSRGSFHAHLAGVHGIAPLLFPFVILHHALGWIFYG